MKRTFHRFILLLRHWFHVISEVHPCIWMFVYLLLIPTFAFIYWALPDGQFRIPDGGGTNYGSWIYYSIVTITTLGFGDYTPACGGAQAVTSVEVMCGLLCMGFFLNSVGAMKGEVDVTSEIERQRQLHQSQEKDKLIKNIPVVTHVLNAFLRECQQVTSKGVNTVALAPELTKAAARASLSLDSLQNRVDLTIWPDLMEHCFAFVANYQILASEVNSSHSESDPTLSSELQNYISENTTLARTIEDLLTRISVEEPENA